VEELFFFLGLGLLVFLLATPVLALLAYLRARRLEREIERLRAWLRQERPAPAPLAPPAEPAAAPAPAREPAPQAAAARPAEVEPVPPAPPAPAPVAAAQKRAGALQRLEQRRRSIDWERWIGVRGAAVVGGILLALAAIFFFVHAVSVGWITPPMRVAGGVGAGIACIAGGLRLRGRGYGWAPDALIGAGLVALYASVWAADKRYHMLSTAGSFPLMALVTALACGLALRLDSLLVVLLGLLGGFATPLLLASGQDRPLTLFGYVLLLDLGLVVIGRRRRWPSIGLLALLGTFLYESHWILLRMQGRSALGLGIVGVFALVFALASLGVPSDQRRRWAPAQMLSFLFPLVFSFYFAGHLEFRGHVWPTALLLGLLFVAAAVTGRLQGSLALPQGAVIAAAAVVAVWLLQVERLTTESAWELVLVALGLALLAHAAGEWERRSGAPERGLRQAAALAGAGWLALLVLGCDLSAGSTLAPLLAGLVLLALAVCRQALLVEHGIGCAFAGLALGLGLGLFHRAHAGPEAESVPDARIFLALPLLLAALGRIAWARAAAARSAYLGHGAALLLCSVALFLPAHASYAAHDPWLLPGAALLYGVLLLELACALRSGAWVVLALVSTLVLDLRWAEPWLGEPRSEEGLQQALFLIWLTIAVLVATPCLRLERLRARASAWPALALSLFFWFPLLEELWQERFGAGLALAPFLLLALPGAALALRLRAARLPASVLALLAFGLAAQLDHEVFAVGAALFALGLAWLARTLPLGIAGSAATGFAALATLALSFAALDAGHYPRSEHVLANWLALVHLLPAAALGLATVLLARDSHEPRRPSWAARLRRGGCGLGAIVILFLWINLAIENLYSREELLALGSQSLAPEETHERDLVTSLSWGVYAILLLVLGTARAITALRWASLAVFFLALGKVFLFDLGHLSGLYRVGSLAGLALSLLAVSLFYQRFVFRRPAATPGSAGGAA
jgi:uncharacterized membrane protein